MPTTIIKALIFVSINHLVMVVHGVGIACWSVQVREKVSYHVHVLGNGYVYMHVAWLGGAEIVAGWSVFSTSWIQQTCLDHQLMHGCQLVIYNHTREAYIITGLFINGWSYWVWKACVHMWDRESVCVDEIKLRVCSNIVITGLLVQCNLANLDF